MSPPKKTKQSKELKEGDKLPNERLDEREEQIGAPSDRHLQSVKDGKPMTGDLTGTDAVTSNRAAEEKRQAAEAKRKATRRGGDGPPAAA